MYFPDPWPKKRHHKRRIVQPDFLELCANRLQPHGALHIATDWANYAEHIDEVLAASDRFECRERREHDGDKPLDRKKASAAVNEAIAGFDENERYFFGLAPEGTRSKTPGWKSGFYRIAEGAGVPVVFGFFDYERRIIGLGPTLTLTGDSEADLDIIRSFYSSVKGRWPKKTCPIVFTR